jgi:hypothetical protein
MESKRGQVTIFIIVAVAIIVIALIFFLVFRQNTTKSESSISEVKTYLSDILERAVLINIITVAQQGGEAYPSTNSFQTPYYNVSYWVIANTSAYPTQEQLAKNIDSLNSEIAETNLSWFFPGYDISSGKLESNTTLTESGVRVSVKWPITIKKGTTTQTIEDFTFNYNIRLKKLYAAATYTADLVANDTMPIEMPQDINVTVYTYSNSALYEIVDTNTKYQLNKQPYNFVFAVK